MTHFTRRTVLISATGLAAMACEARPQLKPSPGTWRTAIPIPLALQEIYPTRHDANIHLAGGFVSDGKSISGATDQHFVYNTDSNDWRAATPLPRARHHPNLVSFDGALSAIGGFEVTSADAVWVMQAGTWTYSGERWKDGPSLPQPNGESVLSVINGALHVCGGRKPAGASNASWNDHTDTGDHYVLDNIDGEWVSAAPLPTARNSAASGLIGQDWHVVGGRTVSDGNSNAHEVYDVREDRWRSAAPMPQAQGGLAAAALGDRLFAFGGEYFDNGGGVYAESWVYSAKEDAWTRLPDMPNPRHGLGAVVMGRDIYLIGGALKVGGQETSDLVEIFTP